MTISTSWKQLKPFRGPKRYKFKDPDTGHTFSANKREELVHQIVSYRAQNELEPIEQLNLVIDAYLCSLPENVHNCYSGNLQRGLLGYIKGGISLIKNMLYDSYVEQDTADARASLCIKCPQNVFPENKETFIHWSDNLSLQVIGDRRSIHHEDLGNCAACSCLLKSKVWLGGRIELDPEEVEQTPSFCWQRKENQLT
jgi:hypothetical protein